VAVMEVVEEFSEVNLMILIDCIKLVFHFIPF
jgi:hypothetical protein